MKLMVDAQLPSKLCEILDHMGIISMHVDQLPKGDETSDRDISSYADDNNMMVLTKDADFYHAHMSRKQPKKLFLITTGNLKNRQLFDLFRSNILFLKNALERSSFLEMNNNGIIEHK